MTIQRRCVPEIFAVHMELSLYSVLSTDLRQNELGSSAPDLIFSEAHHHSRGHGSRVCSPQPSNVLLMAAISEHDCRLLYNKFIQSRDQLRDPRPPAQCDWKQS